ncbi:carboxypeptidase-like regulatory domain-containing protein [Crateriforma spongiae]|uniref:carboxypeptidase-like regulatory domain-containing protein n=1 Tax=Crateriforma spongiae TaxID=2724528 RepID=UPI001444C116|nr:carboxypeptidase-like regulatory domain-containing protein [Crateriforma spongiae]
MSVFDAESGQPISGATIWKGTVRMANTTDAKGKVSISHLSPIATRVHVVADGYHAAEVLVPWPDLSVALAGIDGYQPKVTTNERGRFAIHGIHSDVAFVIALGFVYQFNTKANENGNPTRQRGTLDE